MKRRVRELKREIRLSKKQLRFRDPSTRLKLVIGQGPRPQHDEYGVDLSLEELRRAE